MPKMKPPRLEGLSENISPYMPDMVPVPQGLSDVAELIIDSDVLTIHSRDLKTLLDLGAGQYANVVKVVHEPSKRLFAVKHIRQHYAKKPEIHRDLAVGMKANHSNVIKCYCGLFSEGVVSIVMELMDISMDRLTEKVFKSGNIYPPELLAYIVFSVVDALEYLHCQLKVIHRDVKPSNILANSHGDVKVCDFGISGFLEDSLALTDVGTKIYLPPERIMPTDKLSYGIHVDVWSLGLTVLELATGQPCYPPFQTLYEHLDLVVNSPSPSLPSNSPYSNNLREFIDMCLVKDKATRANYVQLLTTAFLVDVDVSTSKSLFKEFVGNYLDSVNQIENDD